MKITHKKFTITLLGILCNILSYAQLKPILSVYIILNTECPVSQNIVPAINELKIKYPDVVFKSVFTSWDTKPEIEKFKKKYKLQTVIIHDKNHKLINFYSASKTPQVFLINKQKKIIYEGAINNQYVKLGIRKSTDVTSYLEQAITDYLSKGYVRIPKTNAIGCNIEPLTR